MEVNATIIVQAAFFCFLLLWLSPVLFKPMLRLFEEREAQIGGAKKEAARFDEQARQELSRVETQIAKAFDEAKQLKLDMKEEAEDYYRKMVASARSEASKTLHDARQELQIEAAKVSSELRAQVEPLAQLLSSTLLNGQKFPDPSQSTTGSAEVARA